MVNYVQNWFDQGILCHNRELREFSCLEQFAQKKKVAVFSCTYPYESLLMSSFPNLV